MGLATAWLIPLLSAWSETLWISCICVMPATRHWVIPLLLCMGGRHKWRIPLTLFPLNYREKIHRKRVEEPRTHLPVSIDWNLLSVLQIETPEITLPESYLSFSKHPYVVFLSPFLPSPSSLFLSIPFSLLLFLLHFLPSVYEFDFF